MPEVADVGHCITLRNGNVYLSREVCDTYLREAQSVALLWRDEQMLIVPLIRQSGGGLLLKVRNLQGDRIIHAQEFFREKGLLEDAEERHFLLQWSTEMAALSIVGVPRTTG